MPEKLKADLQRLAVRLGFQRDWYLIALAAAIGTVTAFGAIGFVELVHLVQDAAEDLDESLPWWALPVAPMIGALLTGLLVYSFAREAKGHGVPEVMDAVYRKQSRIRPRVAIVKSLASACTIGSGGSAGAEGPIVQIGSAIGSGVAQLLRVTRDQAGTLLGCGAAAGIASVFNAPIAGVFFVLEILLRDFSIRTFTPVVVSSVFSTAVTQAVLGKNTAIFAVSDELAGYVFTLPELPSYLLLGLVCGVVAVGFIRMLYATEDLADRARIHPIVKPVVGAALLGGLGIAYLAIVGHASGKGFAPPFFGNGYPIIRALLDPASFAAGDMGRGLDATMLMLAALVLFKALATCFTLGSGGSGGVFAPSLFLGAAAGASFGVGVEQLGLIPEGGSPAAYALVGMAAVVAGTTHAPLTAILIIFEITRDIYVLLPIMLAAVVATVAAQLIQRDSIYTLKLRRRGVLVGSSLDLTILRRITAREIPLAPQVSVRPDDPVSKLLKLNREYQVADFVVIGDHQEYLGMITSQDVRTAFLEYEAIPLLLIEEIMVRSIPTITPEESLDSVLEKFSKHDVSSLAMVEGDGQQARVMGLVTRARLMARYHQALREN